MKLIKKTDSFLTKIKNKFSDYLNNLKDGESVNFKYDVDEFDNDILKPKIVITPLAYAKIKTLVDKSTGEIGWNGTVEKNGNIYTITDIYVYPQTVTSVTVTCDETETGEWLSKLPDEVFNKLRFQAHSHVNMGTSPSGVDSTMFEKYLNVLDPDDFYIFMIINKKGEFYVEMYDKAQNIIFYKKDVEVTIEGMNEFYTEASKNITIPSPVVSNYYGSLYPDYTKPKESNKKSKDCNKQCKKCKDFKKCLTDYFELLGIDDDYEKAEDKYKKYFD